MAKLKLLEHLKESRKVKFNFKIVAQDETQDGKDTILTLELEDPYPRVLGSQRVRGRDGTQIPMIEEDVLFIKVAKSEIEKDADAFVVDDETADEFNCSVETTVLRLDISQRQEVWLREEPFSKMSSDSSQARNQKNFDKYNAKRKATTEITGVEP